MRILFISLLLLSILSCSQTNSNGKIKLLGLEDLKVSDNTDIFGNWGMCATSGKDAMIQMNVCPIVSFNYSGTGYVGTLSTSFYNATSTFEYFKWTFKNGILTITNFKPTLNSTFPDTTYSVIITKQRNKSDLVIHQVSHDYSYYLSK